MFLLSKDLVFPPVHLADKDGLLAIGGDLSLERLLLAYKSGIFPWYNPGEPIIWYSPNLRMVLFPKDLKISKSMKQIIRKNEFKITFNKNFKAVISNCKTIKRDGQGGTWITDEMQDAYLKLHEKGIAKSVEVWLENELVGGLYGIDLGTVFCGESMFSKISNTSKLAFIYLVQKLEKENYKLIDCQVYNPHLESLGADEIFREDFLKYLK
ncbi:MULTISPECIES: leucyl/phenylalanyl-tRNA--protein transferase [Flavobacteriaceae]|uniref:Leucyl/phenylalanyl-tRNA--protein transferase n=2 Tax=Flavobacteriaceae TaxID=49546 RepID=A0A4Y8AP89_9FLAO|nr:MULTISPECIES: leucyl/phenylalanyl-tRNA--protein transferase [Flavobacteriaceae]TEW72436.1 leucyl/phenylalanyl-tRNA--protein transferase [Gramella jeungdoensis]GGK55842.1 leucyl/phenylalanyl-tRNA--protein transferase [Lutibacter litoralis]